MYFKKYFDVTTELRRKHANNKEQLKNTNTKKKKKKILLNNNNSNFLIILCGSANFLIDFQLALDRDMLTAMEVFFDNQIHASKALFARQSRANPLYLLGVGFVILFFILLFVFFIAKSKAIA